MAKAKTIEVRTPAYETLTREGTDPRNGQPIKMIEVKQVAVIVKEVPAKT